MPRIQLAVTAVSSFALALASSACGSNAAEPEDIGTSAQASTTVCGAAANGPVQGVDVSHFQGAFNWTSAKSHGTAFGYASIGDGTGFSDPDFAANWSNMAAAGVLRGAYQFFEPAQSPIAQANLMIQAVGQLGAGDLPCMVDVEVSGGQSGATIAANVRAWLTAVQAGTGRAPIIYTGPSFWDGSVGDTSFGSVPLWIADYGPSCPKVPNGWSNWTIWQYGDTGGTLDQDVYNGSLAQLTALAQPPAPACTNQCIISARVGVAPAPTGQGYWIVDAAGDVYANGNASFLGDLHGTPLAKPIVGVAATPSGQGYWMVAADGGVFSFGNAGFHGSEGGMTLNAPIVGMAATPDGAGYWLVGADGGIFSFGSAGFFGSAGSMVLNKPVVGMAATPTGQGYWLVAADGGIFAYGDAAFEGSAGSMMLNQPVVGMATTPTGKGYWLVAADGGIFSYGDAVFEGSAGSMPLAKPVVGMASTPGGGGYWLLGADGGIFTYGNASYLGNGLGYVCAAGVAEDCVVASNGCTVLQNTTACPAGQACGNGTCQETCTDACTSGTSQCSGTELQVCGHFGTAPCNTWSTAAACPTGKSCTAGVCSSPVCSDACEPGATECQGSSLLTCTGETDAGCHTWSAPTACQTGQTCQSNGCVSPGIVVDSGGPAPATDAGSEGGGGDGGGGGGSDASHDDAGTTVDASVGGHHDSGVAEKHDASTEADTAAGSGGGCGCSIVGDPREGETRSRSQSRGTLAVGLLALALTTRRRRTRVRNVS